MVVNNFPSISDAARRFGQSLSPEKHQDGQEALRFARWFGEERAANEVRPVDLESYIETFGATAPNAMERAACLKNFLTYAHKQNLMPEKLVSHVRVRRPAARTRAANAKQEVTPELRVTAEGLSALQAELEGLVAQRPRVAAELRAARADGDVRENAPLDAARESQGQMEARIRELEGMLRHAVVSDEEPGASGGSARVGASIVISNLASGAKLTYQLVNPAEARAGSGRLSVDSPVGQAVLGRRQGDEVEVQAPSGRLRFRIESIET